MKRIKFEHRITAAYLLIGCLWILFSDRILHLFVHEIHQLTDIQTYKGWFYVFITSLIFYAFLKKHLNRLRTTEIELENHRNNLQKLVFEKTRDLDEAIEELSLKNKELQQKNDVINNQNADLKDTLEELRFTQARLLQADKMASLGIMTAGIAHEINNPLNYISGGITGLENYLIDNDITNNKTHLFIESIKTGIDRVNSIVSGLNQFSRDRDSFDEICNLHEIIENCLLIINNQLKDRILVTRNFNPEPLFVRGNAGQLHQVFINILSNSIQSISGDGAVSIATRIEFNNAIIEVADTGCGIGDEDLSRITDPFFTTREPGMGTGLGLYIAYNVIQSHKGILTFGSERDKGTIVRISLPLIVEEDV